MSNYKPFRPSTDSGNSGYTPFRPQGDSPVDIPPVQQVYVPPFRRFQPPTEGKAGDLFHLCSHLDSLHVQETIVTNRLCKKCNGKILRVIDESRILLPFPDGPFMGKTALLSNIKFSWKHDTARSMNTGPRAEEARFSEAINPNLEGIEGRHNYRTRVNKPGSMVFHRYASYTTYMIIQDIVRSGLFNEVQLRGADGRFSHLFSRHDLEVNAKAFESIRMDHCGCGHKDGVQGFRSRLEFDLGHSLSVGDGYRPYMGLGPNNQPTVDDEFAAGKRIRTGFRIRSKKARLRRRYRHVSSKYCLHGSCLYDSSLAINVKLRYIPDRRRTRQKPGPKRTHKRLKWLRHAAKAVSAPKCVINVPVAHHWKYWYFLRKRGKVFTSVHHPYGDETRAYPYIVGAIHSHRRPME